MTFSRKKKEYFSNDRLENPIWENEIKSENNSASEIKFFMCIFLF